VINAGCFLLDCLEWSGDVLRLVKRDLVVTFMTAGKIPCIDGEFSIDLVGGQDYGL